MLIAPPIKMRFAILLIALMAASVTAQPISTVPLSSLDLSLMSAGYGRPRVDVGLDGSPLVIAGQKYPKGVCTHASSAMHIRLDKETRRFTALVGVQEVKGNAPASIEFKIYADQRLAFNSGVMRAGDAAKKVDVDLRNVDRLVLVVTDAGDGMDFDHAAWAMAEFEVTGKTPVAVPAPAEPEYILTPEPGPQPQINGPLIFGTRPGNPFLYRIPATGKRPMTFSADNLPASLSLDAASGIITGTSPAKRGDYAVTLHAKNALGEDSRSFKLVVGDVLALTPPMGWNSWYIHYWRVNDADIRNAADAMIQSGMADFGYLYVNIDDYWSKEQNQTPYRDACGRILPNQKFPNMRLLTDYIHSKGLRAGIYSSPGPLTCGNCVASYRHEQIDAQQFADWGFDFLKYDWCSYGTIAKDESRAELVKPYALMGEILKNIGRDVVYNLCQYGLGNVWEWGAKVDGNCWRTTGDLGPMQGGYLRAGLMNARHFEYAKPGRWNDPDYILIGWVGDANTQGEGKKTDLSPSRQYQYISLWSLMAAPLIYSGDMTKLDAFTRNVLCNREVIEVDQDMLGKQGKIIEQSGEHFVMVKDLADGSKAVGIFSKAEVACTFQVSWQTLGIKGQWNIRDLWRQKDIGVSSQEYKITIPSYGVSLIRLSPHRN